MSDDGSPVDLGSTDQLGPLPVTDYTLASGGSFTWAPGYSAAQMRAYAAQAVAAERDRRRPLIADACSLRDAEALAIAFSVLETLRPGSLTADERAKVREHVEAHKSLWADDLGA